MAKHKLLKELLELNKSDQNDDKHSEGLTLTLEHVTYKDIPGTSNSVRHDKGNTNTKTQDHAHVFAKRNGEGKQLFSVNKDGTGHDGSSGTKLSARQAAYLRDAGYTIPDNLTLESLSYESINQGDFEFFILREDA